MAGLFVGRSPAAVPPVHDPEPLGPSRTLHVILTRLPNRIGRRCRHFEVMRVALQQLAIAPFAGDRPAAATAC
jgi:hypothetical protein